MKIQRHKKWLITGFILCMVFYLLSIHAEAQKSKNNLIIERGDTVSIEYTLKLDGMGVVDSNVGSKPLTFKQGTRKVVPGLDKAVLGMKIGDNKKVTIPPQEGYGLVVNGAVIEIDKNKIPEKSHKIGTILEGKDPKTGKTFNAQVIDVKDNKLILDLNHPLAGKTLYFDVKVLDIKKAPL